MARLNGREYSRRELLEKVGDIAQVCEARPVKLAGGRSDGVDAIAFKTGSGLGFTVLPGRGLDISAADYRGNSLCWRSSTGEAAPAYYEPEGLGWLRGFYGGLLVTCGLTHAGAPCRDLGKDLGLHGRVSNLPAQNVWVDGAWHGDDYEVWVQGKVREAVVFGENVLLTRKISARLGESRLFVEDAVENLGHEPVEHMILYHINLGFPLIDEGTELVTPSRAVTPRDEEAAGGAGDWARCSGPVPGFKEKVYYHDLAAAPDGVTRIVVVNRGLMDEGLGLYVAYAKEQLPVLVQWKMMGQGTYVLGIEPANCHVLGRAAERQQETLQFLQPGEVRRYALEIGLLAAKAEIEKTVGEIQALGRQQEHETRTVAGIRQRSCGRG